MHLKKKTGLVIPSETNSTTSETKTSGIRLEMYYARQKNALRLRKTQSKIVICRIK